MGIRFGVLSTYPPTQCGIATFTQALVTHLQGVGAQVQVVRSVDEHEPLVLPVVHEWTPGSTRGVADVAAVLDGCDVAIVQHEYGIYGGPDGADVLDVVRSLTVPVVTVLHTVLTHPTPNQHRVVAALCAASSALVTMTETARDRLVRGWGISPERVSVISHGAEDNTAGDPVLHAVPDARPVVLTWGLLGEGKGIEWALRALAELDDLVPSPLYRIVGQTHPRVLEREGDAYRDRLSALVGELELHASVSFDVRYLPGPALREIVREASVVLLPYDSREQVTSGVLTEAVAAGKPVVSTSFPHAVELLSGGAGLLVPQRDPGALAAALRRVLTEDGLAERMATTSRSLAPGLLWPAVAGEYLALGRFLLPSASRSVA